MEEAGWLHAILEREHIVRPVLAGQSMGGYVAQCYMPSGCAETEYGRRRMESIIDSYTKEECCALAGQGYRMPAEAYAADLPYRIDCPALLPCGERDRAGSEKRYNKKWAGGRSFGSSGSKTPVITPAQTRPSG